LTVNNIHKGKVLGCLVSTKGIEANPDKIKALIEMQDPVSVKDVQKLTSRVATLNRFIPRAVLTMKFRQPSREFTFGVGMSFIPYPLVLTPLV
jgi:hypothetical protein